MKFSSRKNGTFPQKNQKKIFDDSMRKIKKKSLDKALFLCYNSQCCLKTRTKETTNISGCGTVW